MIELIDEARPRSEATVGRLTAVAAKRTKRLARNMGLVFIAIAGISMVIGLAVEISSPDPWTNESLTGPMLFVFMGLLPAWAIRRILMRDVRALRRVARDGIAYRPIAGGDRLDIYGGMTSLSLVWEEDGRQQLGQFDVFKRDLQPTLIRDVRILARPRDRFVLGVLGDNGVFVGMRRRYFGSLAKRRGD